MKRVKLKKKKKKTYGKRTSGETNEKGRGLEGTITMDLHVLKKNMLNHTPKVISATVEGISLTNYLNLTIFPWAVEVQGETIQVSQRPDTSRRQASGCLTDCSSDCPSIVGALQVLASPQKTAPPSSLEALTGKGSW